MTPLPQMEQNQNAPAVLIGHDPRPIARSKSVDDLALPKVPAGVPSALLERRPDLLQAEQELIAANALYFPQISLTGAFGGAHTELANLFKDSARVWSYACSEPESFSDFDGGNLSAGNGSDLADGRRGLIARAAFRRARPA